MKPTQEQVIAWAREAGLPRLEATDEIFCLPSAISLATLAYEAGRESMKVDSIHTCHDQCQRPACVAVREAYEAGRKDENEACANVCVEDASLMRNGTPPQIALMDAAVAIRARRGTHDS